MKILSDDGYLDGGTIKLVTDSGTYYMDGRIETWNSEHPNEVYDMYPNDKGAAIVSSEVKAELIQALEAYHDQSDYMKDVVERMRKVLRK